MIANFSDYFNVDPAYLEQAGALNPVLGIDTRLFIDPRLLSRTAAPELKESSEKLADHFRGTLKLLANVTKQGDVFWRQADRLLTFPEVRGLCIGYSSGSTAGRGMGAQKRAHLLETAWQVVRAGINDPELFELAGIFEEGVGPDLISDMVATILMSDLVAFTQRICSDLGVPMQPQRVARGYPLEDLPLNPMTGKPLILVPLDILSQLPIADSFLDIPWVASFNEQLRRELNRTLGSDWGALSTRDKKLGLRAAFVSEPSSLRTVLERYRELEATPYDLRDDPAGELNWYPASKAAVAREPLQLELPGQPTVEDVYSVVAKICEHYAFLLSERQLCKLLYDKNGALKHESAAQLLFIGVASSYCQANRLDLSPESDAGRGPVDFKISSGFVGKVLVEVKYTSNSNLLHGFERQLPIYMAAEQATKGIYLVIDVGHISDRRHAEFHTAVVAAGAQAPRVMYADGIPRASASKA